MGIGIVGDDQTQITPFQRQVFEAEKLREAEEKERQREQARNGNGRKKNQMAGAGGKPTSSRSETIRYKNKRESGDNDLMEFVE